MFAKTRPALLSVGATIAAAFSCGAAHAGSVQMFQGSSGDYSASASFEFVGNELHITLTNTMTEVSNPHWLTGLFFDIDGAPAINSGSATGDLVTFGPGGTMTPYNAHTASQFWAMRDDIGAGELPFGNQQYGLGAAGFDVFGPGDMLAPGGPGPQPNGIGGGIVPDIADVFVPAGHEGKPFVLGSLSFILNLPVGFGGGDITNVFFAFGSGFDEINFPGTPGTPIPLPAALPMGIAGLIGVLLISRKRRRLNIA